MKALIVFGIIFFATSLRPACLLAEINYMTASTHTVNQLETYSLSSATTPAFSSSTIQDNGNGTEASTVTWGIRAWLLNEDGEEYLELTEGSTVAVVSRQLAATGTEEGIQSSTWTPQAVSMHPTDAVLVRVYAAIEEQWQIQAAFSTGRLGADLLNNTEWTVYYYSEYDTLETTPSQDNYTAGTFHYGDLTYMDNVNLSTETSKIEGFSFSEADPTVETKYPNGITYSSCTLHGDLVWMANKNEVDVFFRYGRDEENLNLTTSSETLNSTGTFSHSIKELDANTTHYFKAAVQWSGGESTGTIKSFRTCSYPAVETRQAQEVNVSSATLSGELVEMGLEPGVTTYFRYRIQEPTAWSTTTAVYMVSTDTFDSLVSNLTSNTTYEFQAVVEWDLSTSTGSIQTFTTDPSPPSFTVSNLKTEPAEIYVNQQTTFSLKVENKGDLEDSYEAEFYINGSTITADPVTIPGTSSTTVKVTYSTSTAGSYTVEAKDTEESEILNVYDHPSVETRQAQEVNVSSATLSGELVEMGLEPGVTTYFRYRIQEPTAWSTTTAVYMVSTDTFDSLVSGLTSNTTYEFQAVVEWDLSESTGSIKTFTTDPSPPSFTASNLKIEPAEIYVNQQTTFSIKVENTGETEDNYEGEFYIGGSTITADPVTIPAASSTTVKVTYSTSTAGSYTVEAKDTEESEILNVYDYPSVETLEAEDVSLSSATLAGKIIATDPPGLKNDVDVFFLYRINDTIEWSSTTAVTKTEPDLFYEKITNLEPKTTYQFKAVLQWDVYESTGEIKTFTTFSTPLLEWAGIEGYAEKGVNPTYGSETTTFTYMVKYTEATGSLGKIELKIDKRGSGNWESYEMEEYNNGDIKSGKIFQFEFYGFSYTDSPEYKFYAKNEGGVQAVGEPVEKQYGPVVDDSVVFYDPLPEPEKTNKTTKVSCRIKVYTDESIVAGNYGFEIYNGTDTSEVNYNGQGSYENGEIQVTTDTFVPGENYIRWFLEEEEGERKWKSRYCKVLVREFNKPKITAIQPGNMDTTSLNPVFQFRVSETHHVKSATFTVTGQGVEMSLLYPGGLNYNSATGILNYNYSSQNDAPLKPGSEYKINIKVTGDNDKTSTMEIVFTVSEKFLSDFINYPNPFDPGEGETVFRYYLSREAKVTLNIYDTGRSLVKTIVNNKKRTPGQNEETWDGRDFAGNTLPNGVYFAEIIALNGKEDRIYNAIAIFR